MSSAERILEEQKCFSASFGGEPLLVRPDGHVLDLATGYIPLLSTFTTEDKAAKGLRKGKEAVSEPEHFSLLERVRDNKILLLSGPTGSSKSTFAKHLCYSLATRDQTRKDATVGNVTSAESQPWDADDLQPCYFVIEDAQDLRVLARETVPTLLDTPPTSTLTGSLIVIDVTVDADKCAAEHIDNITMQILASGTHRHRILLLSNSKASNDL